MSFEYSKLRLLNNRVQSHCKTFGNPSCQTIQVMPNNGPQPLRSLEQMAFTLLRKIAHDVRLILQCFHILLCSPDCWERQPVGKSMTAVVSLVPFCNVLFHTVILCLHSITPTDDILFFMLVTSFYVFSMCKTFVLNLLPKCCIMKMKS